MRKLGISSFVMSMSAIFFGVGIIIEILLKQSTVSLGLFDIPQYQLTIPFIFVFLSILLTGIAVYFIAPNICAEKKYVQEKYAITHEKSQSFDNLNTMENMIEIEMYIIEGNNVNQAKP